MDKKKIEKKQTFQETSNCKGITLAALVITIIILIILSAVTITAVLGDNGLIEQAKITKNITEQSIEDEAEKLNRLSQEYANLMSEDETIDVPKFPIPPGGSVTEDGVPIPNGFYYVGGTKNDGVVISDNPEDENQGTEHDKVSGLQGNQFVWVPVENPSDYFIEETEKLNGVETTTNVYSKLTIRDGDKENYTSVKPGNESSAREPDVLSNYDTDAQYYQEILGYGSTKLMADSFVQEYTEMYESIKKYKGFYIGRYELTGTVDTPTVKAGEVLSASSSQAKNWYGLRKACTEIIKNNANVTSTMIYGVEWDATMNWLKRTKFAEEPEKVDEDSSSWGNYYGTGTGKVEPTGSQEKWSANHIYDLAGNCYDYTQEALNTNYRVHRGRRLRRFRFDSSSIRPWLQLSSLFPQLPFSSSSFNNKVGLDVDRENRVNKYNDNTEK